MSTYWYDFVFSGIISRSIALFLVFQITKYGYSASTRGVKRMATPEVVQYYNMLHFSAQYLYLLHDRGYI